MKRDEEINQFLDEMRSLYSEWMEKMDDIGDNPEKVISYVIAERYFTMKDKYELHEYVKNY